AHIVGQGMPEVAAQLAFTRQTVQLLPNFHHLPYSRGAYGMSLGLQAAAGIDRVAAIACSSAVHGSFPAFSPWEKAQILGRHDFGNCEAVMNFREIDIIRGEACHFVSMF